MVQRHDDDDQPTQTIDREKARAGRERDGFALDIRDDFHRIGHDASPIADGEKRAPVAALERYPIDRFHSIG
jgi:hypothetical protein